MEHLRPAPARDVSPSHARHLSRLSTMCPPVAPGTLRALARCALRPCRAPFAPSCHTDFSTMCSPAMPGTLRAIVSHSHGAGKASTRNALRTGRLHRGSYGYTGRLPTWELGALKLRDVKDERACHLIRHRTSGCPEAGLPHLPKWEACWLMLAKVCNREPSHVYAVLRTPR